MVVKIDVLSFKADVDENILGFPTNRDLQKQKKDGLAKIEEIGTK